MEEWPTPTPLTAGEPIIDLSAATNTEALASGVEFGVNLYNSNSALIDPIMWLVVIVLIFLAARHIMKRLQEEL